MAFFVRVSRFPWLDQPFLRAIFYLLNLRKKRGLTITTDKQQHSGSEGQNVLASQFSRSEGSQKENLLCFEMCPTSWKGFSVEHKKCLIIFARLANSTKTLGVSKGCNIFIRFEIINFIGFGLLLWLIKH